jgi:hypothetical protein
MAGVSLNGDKNQGFSLGFSSLVADFQPKSL